MRSIFTDIRVMKTSTFFACGLPKNDDDLHTYMSSMLPKNGYQIQKVFSENLNTYVGVAGFVSVGAYIEYLIFLKPEYMKNNIGNLIGVEICKMGDLTGKIQIASIWEGNIPSILVTEKNGLHCIDKVTKEYDGRKIVMNLYQRFSQKNTLINLAYFITNNSLKSI